MWPYASQARLQAHMRGFTLIELLVALFIMVLMAGMGWQVVNTLYLTEQQVRQHSQPLQRWQTVLAQWQTDLDQWQDPGLDRLPVIDFNGLVLRWVRRVPNPQQPDQNALAVVAWAVLEPAAQSSDSINEPVSGLQWMRWQSPALLDTAALREAWSAAETWAQSQTRLKQSQAYQQRLVPVQSWQLYFYRQGSWINPQSTQAADMPDGVRLQITSVGSAPKDALSSVTYDWLNPHVGGGKSQ